MKYIDIKTDMSDLNMSEVHKALSEIKDIDQYQVLVNDDGVQVIVSDDIDEVLVEAVFSKPEVRLAIVENPLTDLREDLAAQYQTAVDRLNAIITNGPTYTAVQTRDAVIDMAKIELRMLKLMKSALT